MTKDPYQVLGISRNATEDEIKAAYRDLARKYHPDNYVNSPLKDVAEERMKEINEAYDLIQKERANGGGQQSGFYGYGSGSSASSTNRSEYNRARNCINNGDIAGAESILNSISELDRGAEWNFLMGCVCAQKGWNFDAQRYFETACSMDPSNAEYRSALNNMRFAGQNFGGGYRTSGNGSGCSGCDVCSTLLCADCLCECCGGDLIRCC